MTAPSDPTALTWMAAVLAWALAVPLYFISKFAAVIPHEGGHAIVGKLLFRSVRSIRFGRDGGGGTEIPPPVPWLAAILIGLAGYLGPSLFGCWRPGCWSAARPTRCCGGASASSR